MRPTILLCSSAISQTQSKENQKPRTPSTRKSGQAPLLIPENILNSIQIAIHQQIAEQEAQQDLSMDSQSIHSDIPTKKEKKIWQSESSEGSDEKEVRLNLREWKVCERGVEFKESKQIVNKYLQTFLGKKESKEKTIPSKLTIQKVFAEKVFRSIAKEAIQNQPKELNKKEENEVNEENEVVASFQTIKEFFQKSPLFYQISNIHPDALNNLLERSARTHPAALTLDQFTRFFDLNNSAQDFNSFEVDKVSAQCVLTPKDWAEVKQVFDRLDVFGKQTAPIEKLLNNLQKVKELTYRTAITFSLGRSYSFKQVIWQLTHKFVYTEAEQITWENFRKKLMEFSHIESPTIDQIQQRQVSLGFIDSNTNGFLISAQLLEKIKNTCKRMPKYGGQFYKIRHFCSQAAERKDFEVSAGEPIRTFPKIVTLKQTLHSIKTNAPTYLNLDQLLLCFSIKGCSLLSTTESKSVSSASKDSQRPLPKKKIIQAQKKQKQQKKSVHCETVPVEFNLTKSKNGIRAQKVKEMIEQLQRKEKRELAKKFKAKAIPISNNPQRYNEYRLEMQKIKDGIKEKLQQKRTEDEQLMEYLRTNTKLFSPKNVVSSQSVSWTPFEANSVPWNTHMPLLDHIQKDKKARREELRRESKQKYTAAWKKLPPVVTGAEQCEAFNIRTESECDLLNEFADLVKETPRIKPVPDFNALHRQFQRELQRKKKQIQPTIPQEFHLSKPNIKPHLQSNQSNESNFPTMRKTLPNNPPLIRSTLKYEGMVTMRVMKEELEEERKVADEQQMKKQKMGERHFKKYVQKCIKIKMRKEKGGKWKKYRQKGSRLRVNKQYGRAMRRMYERVWQRPLLLDCGTVRGGAVRGGTVREAARRVRIPAREEMGNDQ